MSGSGVQCGACGIWRDAGPLRCACGFEPSAAWRDAATSMFASLVVAASVAAAVFLVSSSPVGWALALVPILVAGVPMSVVGVLKGVKAARGNGAPRAFGCLGMFVCMVLFAVPGVAMVVWVVLLLIR